MMETKIIHAPGEGREKAGTQVSSGTSLTEAPHQRECFAHLEGLETLLGCTLTPTSTTRRPSFADYVSAVRKTRAGSVFCSQPVDEARNHEGGLPRVPQQRGTPTVAYSDETSSCPGSVGEEQLSDVTPFVRGCEERSQYGTRLVDDTDEVEPFRELVQRKDEDLRMAGLIGQRLLDKQEELVGELEALREEKWLADCENDALRRDLEHATQLCVELEKGSTSAVGLDSTETNQCLDMWSSTTAAAAGPGEKKSSLTAPSTMGVIHTTSPAEEEVMRLRQFVENLEAANNKLKEELVDARIEATALKRSSAGRREELLNQEGIDAEDQKDQLGQKVDKSASEMRGRRSFWANDAASMRWGRHSNGGSYRSSDTDEEGLSLIDTRDYINMKSPINESEGRDKPRAGKQRIEQDTSDDKPKDHEPESETVEEIVPVDYPGEDTHSLRSFGCNSEREEAVTPWDRRSVITATSASGPPFRHASLSYADEHSELIEALRGQVAEFRLEVEKTKGTTSAVGPGSSKGVAQDEDLDGRGIMRCSSDDDSESGSFRIGKYPASAYTNIGVKRMAKNCSGDKLLLQARVSELLTELATVNATLDVIQPQAQANQGATIDLQREVLSLSREAQHSAAAAATARYASARKSWPELYAHQESDGYDRKNNCCLDNHGSCWLFGFWRRFMEDRCTSERGCGASRRACNNEFEYGCDGEDGKLEFCGKHGEEGAPLLGNKEHTLFSL